MGCAQFFLGFSVISWFMEACEVVRLFVNKTVVPGEPRRRGNPGYGSLRAVRLLVAS